MSQFRKDPISDRWVIIAEGRNLRPSDFGKEPVQPADTSSCPFCAGREAKTPAEIYAVRSGGQKNGSGWQVRVVPNKFPVVLPQEDFSTDEVGVLTQISGTGVHEVVIESPDHHQGLAELPAAHVLQIVQTFIARMQTLYQDPRYRYVQLFKNHGKMAGASLSHPHSQLMALPLIPPSVAAEIAAAQAFYKKHRRCLFCDLIEQEISAAERMIEATAEFIVYAPFASRFPFEIHILPRGHAHDFTQLSAGQQVEFSRLLKRSLQRLNHVYSGIPYNVLLHTTPNPNSFPDMDHIQRAYHWHLEILPRLTTMAGFEWASGMFINPTLPEIAADYLRKTSVP